MFSMVKRNMTLYVDSDNVEIARARGVNLSRVFNHMLEGEINSSPKTPEETLINLKARNALLMDELERVRKEKDKLQKINSELKEEIAEQNEKKHLIPIIE